MLHARANAGKGLHNTCFSCCLSYNLPEHRGWLLNPCFAQTLLCNVSSDDIAVCRLDICTELMLILTRTNSI